MVRFKILNFILIVVLCRFFESPTIDATPMKSSDSALQPYSGDSVAVPHLRTSTLRYGNEKEKPGMELSKSLQPLYPEYGIPGSRPQLSIKTNGRVMATSEGHDGAKPPSYPPSPTSRPTSPSSPSPSPYGHGYKSKNRGSMGASHLHDRLIMDASTKNLRHSTDSASTLKRKARTARRSTGPKTSPNYSPGSSPTSSYPISPSSHLPLPYEPASDGRRYSMDSLSPDARLAAYSNGNLLPKTRTGGVSHPNGRRYSTGSLPTPNTDRRSIFKRFWDTVCGTEDQPRNSRHSVAPTSPNERKPKRIPEGYVVQPYSPKGTMCLTPYRNLYTGDPEEAKCLEGQIVGNDLDYVCKIPGKCTDNLLNILHDAMTYIRSKKKAYPHGIFREAGSVSTQKIAIEGLEEQGSINWDALGTLNAAGIVKKIVATNYIPLLLPEQYDRIARFKTVNEELKPIEMFEILDNVEAASKVYHKTLISLFEFLNELLDYAGETGMIAENLAIVFAPGLARPPKNYYEIHKNEENNLEADQARSLPTFIEFCINHIHRYVNRMIDN